MHHRYTYIAYSQKNIYCFIGMWGGSAHSSGCVVDGLSVMAAYWVLLLASEASLHSRTNGAIFLYIYLYIYISLTDAVAHTVMFYVNSNFAKLQYSVRSFTRQKCLAFVLVIGMWAANYMRTCSINERTKVLNPWRSMQVKSIYTRYYSRTTWIVYKYIAHKKYMHAYNCMLPDRNGKMAGFSAVSKKRQKKAVLGK